MKLRIHPDAEAETQAAALWYERQCAGLGLEFLAAIDTGVQQIRREPRRFPLLETLPEEYDVRRLLIDRFPYLIVYEVTADEVHILAVAHARRCTGYWKDRR